MPIAEKSGRGVILVVAHTTLRLSGASSYPRLCTDRMGVRSHQAAPLRRCRAAVEYSPTDPTTISTARKYFQQPMCGGIGILDYDSDGWMDIFFSNGAKLPELKED